MRPRASDAIDIVEASYDMEANTTEWLANLLRVAAPTLDRGMGCMATLSAGWLNGELAVRGMALEGAAQDLPGKFGEASQKVPSTEIAQTTETCAGKVGSLYEFRDQMQETHAILTEYIGCKDILGVWALDPNLAGVHISAPSKRIVKLTAPERMLLQQLAVHITAGSRLRFSLSNSLPEPVGLGEALLEPKQWRISEVAEDVKDPALLNTVREEAARVDRARGKLRREDPEAALALWQGLVRGRWSLIDWFDADGRRFVLAKPNAPKFGDPRGLTEAEQQVTAYAAQGESGKMIGYRFGLAPQRVSDLLKSAMRKLGASTQAQLVEKMRGMPFAERASDEATSISSHTSLPVVGPLTKAERDRRHG